jgi:hypothetical protein
MNSDHEHKNELLQIKKKRLQALEKQAERFGPTYIPAHIEVEINELRTQIQDLEKDLGIKPLSSQAPVTNSPKLPLFTTAATQAGTAQQIRPDQTANAQKLRIFLCHASVDKPAVRTLYRQLIADGYQPWLDEEDLLPGQTWELAIKKAVQASDVVIVCLSHAAVTTAGFRNKEIKLALDVADMQPEGTIFIIPLKLEACEVPDRLSSWHWVNYFAPDGYARLLKALQMRSGDKA